MLCRPLGPWLRGFFVCGRVGHHSSGAGLELAEKGRGCTYPNPVVGAVIVRDGAGGRRGLPRRAGSRSRRSGRSATQAGRRRGAATLYVTLEPCCSYGRTPPCTTALIRRRSSRVVVGAIDPSAEVNGKGIAQLRAAGMEVDVAEGDIALRCKRQNNGFRKAVATGLPFVTYKYAMTLDGRVACRFGDSRWVRARRAGLWCMACAALSDAVVVGAGTLRTDDPLLTARGVACSRQPLRVVVDGALTIGRGRGLGAFEGEGPVLVVCSLAVEAGRRAEVESWGIETACVESDIRSSSAPAAYGLGSACRPSSRCLLWLWPGCWGREGCSPCSWKVGRRLAGSWWSAGLIDRSWPSCLRGSASGHALRSPLVGAGAEVMASAVALREVETQILGTDLCVSGYMGEAY